ncbi:sigma-70 family RNA polymerase sigma factor [Lacinutrix neustonica]|uniref:Sigma-70 family RNA polymerase sigma factor n=1 Tax=Lacinutrix neustonica TaxID=2980107 RepID=A0A9E8MWU0_9FLAO|nr:sigma-70 family RNA polymerase sigma factor [Lacinutrix neustonica]WAC02364.1 sigma-70 family RNA polymerase sigma factor [Lacinutrix neustonica]
MTDNQFEKSVWDSFLDGNKSAFSTLFKLHYASLHNYGLKISGNIDFTEDCLQDFFVYLFENRAQISAINSIKSYLFISFRRALLRALKKERQYVNYDIPLELLLSFEFSSEEIAIKQEFTVIKSSVLTNLLNALSVREREAIYLKYYSNLKLSEIALIMNISYQSVLNTLQKAYVKLRKNIETKALQDVLKNN